SATASPRSTTPAHASAIRRRYDRLQGQALADRDLIIGVLAVQAGFATPAQVMSAAAGWLMEKEAGPLSARLVAAGVLTAARRNLLDAMADEAIAAHPGDGKRALDSLGGDPAVS